MIDSAEYVKYYKSQKIKPFIRNGLLEDCALRLYYSIIHASHLKSYKDIINVSRRVKKINGWEGYNKTISQRIFVILCRISPLIVIVLNRLKNSLK